MAPAAEHSTKNIKSENSKSLKVLEELLGKLTISKASSVPVRSAYNTDFLPGSR
jgi:hypothetical protein